MSHSAIVKSGSATIGAAKGVPPTSADHRSNMSAGSKYFQIVTASNSHTTGCWLTSKFLSRLDGTAVIAMYQSHSECLARLLRHSASDGGISDPRNAFFGFMTGRELLWLYEETDQIRPSVPDY